MNKSIALALSLLILAVFFPAKGVADQLFKDMPEKHWAEPGIKKLIDLGIPLGFPDKTFAGEKKISRYELAGLLDKLGRLYHDQPEIQKLIAEIKNEFNVEKEKQRLPLLPTLSGLLETSLIHSSWDYRAILKLEDRFNENTSLIINFDTMDAGFNNTSTRDLLREMLDLQARFKFSEINFLLTAGGGDFIHRDQLTPSAAGIVFKRKKNSISGEIVKNHVRMKTGYTALKNSADGLIGTHDLSFGLGYAVPALGLLGRTEAMTILHYVKNNARDVRGEIEIRSNPSPTSSLAFQLGLGSAKISGLSVGVEAKIGSLRIQAVKAGSAHRAAGLDKYDYLPLNLFGKYILDGTTDLGLEYTLALRQNLKTKITADAVLNSSLTTQLDLILGLSKFSSGRLFYRNYSVPSGINYADPAIAESVPPQSELLGIGFEMEL